MNPSNPLISRLLVAVIVCLTALAGLGGSASAAATTPPAAPWGQYTTSANTDPRLGPVTVDQGMGKVFVAQCSADGTLFEAYVVHEYPFTDEYATEHADVCRPNFRMAISEGEAGNRRHLNTDMRDGWVVTPNQYGVPTGWVCAADGIGIGWNLQDGMPVREVFQDEPLCRMGGRA